MKGLLNMPGEWDMLKDNEVLMLDEPDNFPVPTAIGLEFNRDGRRYRVGSVVDTFVIATAIDAVLDNHGEPSRSSDIIKVSI